MSDNISSCVSCGAPMNTKFCPTCGEKKISTSDFTLSHLIEQGIDVFTHLDSKLFKSAKALVLKPGLLTRVKVRIAGTLLNPI